MKHNFYFKHSKGSALITVVAVAAIIMSMIALSTAKISQASLGSLDSTKIALQAQQYAAAEASVLQATNYDDLTAHSKEEIQNTDYFSEVELSEESDYNDDIKQRTATIRIYRGSENLPRYTLESILLSKNEESGVPVGTVIAWPASSMPQDSGTWLECNGQSCAAYPGLVSVLGRSTVPDYRGVFLRGYGSRTNNSITHSSGSLGSFQNMAFPSVMNGTFSAVNTAGPSPTGPFKEIGRYADYGLQDNGGYGSGYCRYIQFNLSTVVPTANELRPINIAVKFIIKAA